MFFQYFCLDFQFLLFVTTFLLSFLKHASLTIYLSFIRKGLISILGIIAKIIFESIIGKCSYSVNIYS